MSELVLQLAKKSSRCVGQFTFYLLLERLNGIFCMSFSDVEAPPGESIYKYNTQNSVIMFCIDVARFPCTSHRPNSKTVLNMWKPINSQQHRLGSVYRSAVRGGIERISFVHEWIHRFFDFPSHRQKQCPLQFDRNTF